MPMRHRVTTPCGQDQYLTEWACPWSPPCHDSVWFELCDNPLGLWRVSYRCQIYWEEQVLAELLPIMVTQQQNKN